MSSPKPRTCASISLVSSPAFFFAPISLLMRFRSAWSCWSFVSACRRWISQRRTASICAAKSPLREARRALISSGDLRMSAMSSMRRRRLAAATAKARMPRRAEPLGDFCFHGMDARLLTAKRAADLIRMIFGKPSAAHFFLMPTDCIPKNVRGCDRQSAFIAAGRRKEAWMGVFCR